MAYDGAGNLSWSASGQALPSTTACDTASVAANQKVSRTYDARNRILSLAFPGSNGTQSWSYTPDGLPSSVTTYNDGGASSVVNGYTYNRRRMLTGESQVQAGGFNWAIGYGYNANGHLSSLVHPSNLTVDYAPNALGQPTQAGPYANNVQYHPNGAMKQFTYGNGLVHTMTQNARQLPARSTDSGGVLDLAYAYDANGNVSSITDYTSAGCQTRSMTYDGRDRLLTVASPLYPGGATYAYDVLDNLTRVTVAGRDHRYLYDANNRLTNVTNGAGGPSVGGLSYDMRGNLANKNGQVYGFDHGNRLRAALGTESYRYDAYGRRTFTLSDSAALYEMYSQSGQLLWQRDENVGNRYDYIYLNGTVVAVRSRAIGSEANDPIYWHTDALGSQIAATVGTTVVQTTEHEPYGKMLNRDPHNRPGYTGHVMDQATKLSYMQQRYYDPQIGLFLSVDPVTAHSDPVVQFHRYRYANNNPYEFTDPDGRQAIGRALTKIIPPIIGPNGQKSEQGVPPGGNEEGSGERSPERTGTRSGDRDPIRRDRDGNPVVRGSGERPSKTPNSGEPGSVHVNSGSGQERLYGEDGLPELDVDYDHNHGQGQPHEHPWTRDADGRPVRGEGRPVPKREEPPRLPKDRNK